MHHTCTALLNSEGLGLPRANRSYQTIHEHQPNYKG